MQQAKFSYETDYQWGKRREIECLPKIKEFFNNPEIKITKKTYSPYDYWAPGKLRIELKSRTNSRTAYNCTLISLTKVEYAKKHPKNQSYFVFDFSNGIYWVKYDEKLFDDFKITKKIRRDRGKNEINYYVNIPISKLKEM